MTTPPKTMEEIRDAEAKKYHGWGTSANQAYKYGFDCAFNESENRTRVINEALKIAVDILEHKSKRSSYEWSTGGDYFPSDYANEGQLKCASEILAEIRKLRPENG